MSEARLLISWYSVTGLNAALARAADAGARGVAGCRVRRRPAHRTRVEDLAWASGYLFVAPENFGQLSGGLRLMFERCFYPLETALQGRPYALIVGCGNDGRGAVRDVDRICAGWRLRPVAEAMIWRGGADMPAARLREGRAQARELGAALAEGLAGGIF